MTAVAHAAGSLSYSRVLMIDEAKAFLLEGPRVATLVMVRDDGSPIGVPVWFDWDGEVVRMFAAGDSKKVDRLRDRPAASLVIHNTVDEPEAWIAWDGDVTIGGPGAGDLALRLARRYWDLDDPSRKATYDAWAEAPDTFVLLVMTPSRVRSG